MRSVAAFLNLPVPQHYCPFHDHQVKQVTLVSVATGIGEHARSTVLVGPCPLLNGQLLDQLLKTEEMNLWPQ